jgi:hypothetical protein
MEVDVWIIPSKRFSIYFKDMSSKGMIGFLATTEPGRSGARWSSLVAWLVSVARLCWCKIALLARLLGNEQIGRICGAWLTRCSVHARADSCERAVMWGNYVARQPITFIAQPTNQPHMHGRRLAVSSLVQRCKPGYAGPTNQSLPKWIDKIKNYFLGIFRYSLRYM